MAQEEIIFKISADAGQANKETENLEANLEAVNDAAEELIGTSKSLDSTFEDIYGDLKPLSGRLGELEDRMYELALAGQQNSTEFKELQQEAASYRQVLISVDKSVDQLAEQGRGLGAALQLGSAVTAGYGAVQGSMVALGIKNESLEKSFVKLQAVQTILASLEQLKLALDKQSILVTKAKAAATWVMTAAQGAWTFATSATTTAMIALKFAMLAIPLVAIIAGITAIVVLINSLGDATAKVTELNKKFNDTNEKSIDIINRRQAAEAKSIENRIKLANAQGASMEEIHQLELEQIDESEKARKKNIEVEKTLIAQKSLVIKKARELNDKELTKTLSDEIKASRARYMDLRAQDNDYYVNRTVLIAEQAKKLAEEEKKTEQERNSRWKAASEKRKRQEEQEARTRLEREKLLRDLVIANIEDEELRKLTSLEESHKRQRAEIINKYGEDTLLIANLERKQEARNKKVKQ